MHHTLTWGARGQMLRAHPEHTVQVREVERVRANLGVTRAPNKKYPHPYMGGISANPLQSQCIRTV